MALRRKISAMGVVWGGVVTGAIVRTEVGGAMIVAGRRSMIWDVTNGRKFSIYMGVSKSN